ncbi:hypothetical protein HYH03_013287 [Edaphochlamys debaryana]|uniref:Uncharacterized protein n=1 Tax=Edaphochlamys debaryana TaxID=47281 RepID=A0A836BTI9_9CHLO|nr:hypothetical protein HYH03_013287 [Edaphochlamys debaryana]|eukprot:KAG2488142.1 hypothetical protein HYH03_013287 [Edaphochlamys debaryana]
MALLCRALQQRGAPAAQQRPHGPSSVARCAPCMAAAAAHSSRLLPPLRVPRALTSHAPPAAPRPRPRPDPTPRASMSDPLSAAKELSELGGLPADDDFFWPLELHDRSPTTTFAAALHAARANAAQAVAGTALELLRSYAAARLHTRTDAYLLFEEAPSPGGAGLHVWMLDDGTVESLYVMLPKFRYPQGVGDRMRHGGAWQPPAHVEAKPLPKKPTALVQATQQALSEALQELLGEERSQVDLKWAARHKAAQDAAHAVLDLLLRHGLSRVHTRTEAFFLLAEDDRCRALWGGGWGAGLRVWALEPSKSVSCYLTSAAADEGEEGNGFPSTKPPDLVEPSRQAVLAELGGLLGDGVDGAAVKAEWSARSVTFGGGATATAKVLAVTWKCPTARQPSSSLVTTAAGQQPSYVKQPPLEGHFPSLLQAQALAAQQVLRVGALLRCNRRAAFAHRLAAAALAAGAGGGGGWGAAAHGRGPGSGTWATSGRRSGSRGQGWRRRRWMKAGKRGQWSSSTGGGGAERVGGAAP